MKHNLNLLTRMLNLGERQLQTRRVSKQELETLLEFRRYVRDVRTYADNATRYPKTDHRSIECQCRPGGHCNVECNS